MLKTKLLHPEILHALASAGHGSQVLIADGNYPFSTRSPASARKVFLNLAPGIVPVSDVLEVLAETIPIESATVMTPPDGTSQPIFGEFRQILPADVEIVKTKRFEFYDKASAPQTALVIATAEQRRFANLLLTIGVVK